MSHPALPSLLIIASYLIQGIYKVYACPLTAPIPEKRCSRSFLAPVYWEAVSWFTRLGFVFFTFNWMTGLLDDFLVMMTLVKINLRGIAISHGACLSHRGPLPRSSSIRCYPLSYIAIDSWSDTSSCPLRLLAQVMSSYFGLHLPDEIPLLHGFHGFHGFHYSEWHSCHLPPREGEGNGNGARSYGVAVARCLHTARKYRSMRASGSFVSCSVVLLNAVTHRILTLCSALLCWASRSRP